VVGGGPRHATSREAMMKRIGTFLLVAATVVVLFGDPVYALWAAVVAVAAAWIVDPASVRTGFRFGIVLGMVFAAAVTAAVVAWAEGPARGVSTGGMVLLRLLVLTVAAAVIVRSVNAEKLLRATERFGLNRLGLVLGLALNSMPRVVEAATEVWTATRVRHDGAVARLRRLPGVGEVLLAHTARIAEEAAAAASLRGHSALTRRSNELGLPIRVVVVTGPSDGGKTNTVTGLSSRLQNDGVRVFGFVQPGVYEEEQKVGFRLRDVATGEEAVLATRGTRREGRYGTYFQFFDEGFELGRKALQRVKPGSLLVIDELGPVELRGEGHMPAVRDALAVPDLIGAVIVVRRHLVPSLLAELNASDAIVIDVEKTGDRAADAVLEALRF